MYNSYHISFCCCHDTLRFVSFSARMCLRFGHFYFFYFKFGESYAAPPIYPNISVCVVENQPTDARSPKPTHLLKVTHVFCYIRMTCFLLTVFIFVHPAAIVPVCKVFLLFFFSPYVKNVLMSFQFVSLVFNCMSKGVCISGSFFFLVLVFLLT